MSENTGTGEVHRLRANSVGLVGVVFMAIATAAPITAMTGNLPVAVGFGNGIGAPAGYLFATLVLTIFSVGYVSMAKHITAAGAFYGYVSHGLGRVAGMASGLLAVMAYIVFEASIIGIFANFAHTTFLDQLGWDVHWSVWALGVLVVIAILGYFDIHLTARVLGVALVAEIAVLALVSLAVMIQGGGPDGIPTAPINPSNAFDGAAGLGLFFAFWSWVGFESTAMYGEESRDPKRVIPIATLISVVGVGLFYVFVSWMTISGNGLDKSVEIAQSSSPLDLFFGPTEEFVGHWAVTCFQWLLLTGSFACAMAFHQCAARYLYAIGREGFLHPALGRTHGKHGSPHIASVVQSCLALVIIVAFLISAPKDGDLQLYVLLAILGTMAILIVQTLCSFAVIGYFRNHHPESRHWFKTFAAPLAGGIAMLFVIYLLLDNMTTAGGAYAGTLFFDLIPWIVGIVFFGGIGLALWLKQARPADYDRIGRVILEDAAERADDDGGGEPAKAESVPV